MYDLIHVCSKQQCLEIAEKNGLVSSVDSTATLWNLPDDIFGSIVTCGYKRGKLYHTTKGYTIPEMFVQRCYADQEIQYDDEISCSIGPSLISKDTYIGNDPWILKIDTATTQIEVNPDVRDTQKNALVNEILSALDNFLLKNYRTDATIAKEE